MGPEAPTETTPERPRTVVGIWLVPITPDDRIFLVENRIAKHESQKVPGQLNCPAETYRKADDIGSFTQTIKRAVREEIGQLDYNPFKVRAMGLIKLPDIGKPVVAAPYLIPVASEGCVTFEPKDVEESINPQWLSIDEIDHRTINIGQYEVPLFRTPMQEIVQMVRYQQNGRSQHFVHSNAPIIGREVYDYLQSNSSSALTLL